MEDVLWYVDPVKSDGLRGTRVGTFTFLCRKGSIVPYVTRGGRGAPKPMQ